MRQLINLYETDLLPKEREFIIHWKERKHYPNTTSLTIGEAIELLIATTTNLHKDDSIGRFFNNVLDNGESAVLYDGDELLDILFYAVKRAIKQRFIISRIIPETFE
jgi:NTP pyrophosphatase (non-canonical NTP hydrolase)